MRRKKKESKFGFGVFESRECFCIRRSPELEFKAKE